jgi:hypothetical protein
MERTLTSDEVAGMHKRIGELCRDNFGVEIR